MAFVYYEKEKGELIAILAEVEQIKNKAISILETQSQKILDSDKFLS